MPDAQRSDAVALRFGENLRRHREEAKAVRLAHQRLMRLEKPRRRSSLSGNYKLVIDASRFEHG